MKNEIEQPKSTPIQELVEAQVEEFASINHNENITLYLKVSLITLLRTQYDVFSQQDLLNSTDLD